MHLHHLYVICALAGAFGVSAGAVSAPVRAFDSSPDACPAINTATVYITIASDATVVEVAKIETIPSTPDQPLTNLVEASEASTLPAMSPTGSASVVVITSFVTVVPIQGTPSTLTSTTTLHSTLKLTEVYTVTKSLETSLISEPITSPSGEQAAPTPATVTLMATPSTITRTLSVVKPVQTITHYPGWESTAANMASVPSGVSKNPATADMPSDGARSADESTVDIFQTSHTTISLSVLVAKSGFMNNPVPSGTTTVNIGIGNAGLPSRTLASSSSTASSASLAPSKISAPSVETSGASASDVVINPKSSVANYSTFVSSGTVHTLTGPTSFSTRTPPTTIGSTVQYPSTRRYFNTTSQSIASSVVPTSTLAASTPNTSQCGEQGDFILNFDDIPPLTLGNSSSAIEPAPVFNPYHQFDFSDGFTVAPPPIAPFFPSSGPLMLEFLPSFVIGVDGSGSNTAQEGFAGQISDGDHGLTGCFTFNIYGATFGCNSTGLPCDFTFTGLHYEAAAGAVTSITSQSVTIPACPGLLNCRLEPVVLDHRFVGLSAVQIKAAAGGVPLGWWIDDLQLGWFNNSCSTGLCRESAHIR